MSEMELFEFEKKFREQIQQCSKCGFCQAVCPLFKVTLRPSYNARGKMLVLLEVLERKIELNGELIETLFQCTTCAGCVESCPAGVRVPEIIKQVRKDMVERGNGHPAFKGMEEGLKRHTNIYGEEGRKDFGRKRNERAEYLYFVGCVGSYREEEATLATLRLLDRTGIDYTLIDEVCCSGVLEDVGFQINEDLARKNIDLILATKARKVLTGCPYCARTFQEQPAYEELKREGIAVSHLSQFLKKFDFGVKSEKRITYHDPCDLGRHCGIYEDPRETIRKIAPHFVEMVRHRADALCCGAGGGVRGAYPKNSIAMARLRLRDAEEVGAEILLTDCYSCLHNLSNARSQKRKVKVYSTAQFISELMEENERTKG